MHRPKRLANKVVEQWEQTLLLKVMQRKIKCAKSTISGIQGPKKSQSQASLGQKRRTCLEICEEEWNLLDADQQRYLTETLKSQFDQLSKSKGDGVITSKDKETSSNSASAHGDVTTNEYQHEENISAQLGTSHDGHQHEQGFPNSIENFINLTEQFHENFRDSEDDLLSQIWKSCKRENSLFDDTAGPNQTRKARALHTADFDSSPIPMSKMAYLKERRIPKSHIPNPKKNLMNELLTVSQFMKKRETGWRD